MYRSIIIILVAALLVGCSSNGFPSAPAMAPALTPADSVGGGLVSVNTRKSGIAPQFIGELRSRGRQMSIKPSIRRDMRFLRLAVSDADNVAVDVLNRAYQPIYAISDGISSPDGDWIDPNGNLYVANYAGGPVVEYDRRGSLLTTYSNRLKNPVDVKTDSGGNIYVAEYSTNMVYMFEGVQQPASGATRASKMKASPLTPKVTCTSAELLALVPVK
ncbi:MAG: hypothetical protein WB681_05680 [Candidatus Cybelea sp.]